jgi:hypothetical protein
MQTQKRRPSMGGASEDGSLQCRSDSDNKLFRHRCNRNVETAPRRWRCRSWPNLTRKPRPQMATGALKQAGRQLGARHDQRLDSWRGEHGA